MKILVVEDDLTIQKQLKNLIKSAIIKTNFCRYRGEAK